MSKLTQAKRMDNILFSGIRKVSERIDELQKKGEDIINLTIGRPDFDTPKNIKKAAISALEEGHVHYTSNYGIATLQKALKEKLLKENEIRLKEKELIVTVGASEAIMLAFLSILNSNDEVLIPNPSWLNYFYCAELAGAKGVSYMLLEENDYKIDIKEIENLITDNTKMIVINTPQNPTGSITGKEKLKKIAKIAQKKNIIVLSDEIYEKILYDKQQHYSIASFPGMKERTLTINGFSKAYSMTGWRIGYIAGPKELIDPLLKVHQYTVTCPTSFAQYGALEALRNSESDIAIMKNEFEKRRNLVFDRINKIPYLSLSLPKGSLYAFVNIKELNMTSEEASDYFLQRARVAMVPGSVFGRGGEGYLRLSFANSYENIEKALDNIEKEIGNFRQKT